VPDRIEFGAAYELPLPEEGLPPKFLGNEEGRGIPMDAPFQLFILKDTMDRIWEHVRRAPTVEQAGVLVGHPFVTFDGKTVFVIITAAVSIQPRHAAAAHVVITPEASIQARRHIEREYPGLRPVGWYHSHPGLGIFLSVADSQITHSIYDADWHLAMVLDPQTGKWGIFRGSQEEKLPGYLLLREAPPAVRVMAAYNRGLEFEGRGDGRLALDELLWIQEVVESLPEFRAWRERGGYRDVDERIDQILSQLDALQDRDVTPPVDHDERRVATVERLYRKGLEDMKAGAWDQAWQKFQVIHTLALGYRDVEELIEVVKARRADTRKPKGTRRLRGLLRQLLTHRRTRRPVSARQPSARSRSSCKSIDGEET
jgi:proteasome lid subunit RPN8/RPN11